MPRTIQVVYEKGVLKPLHRLDLAEQQKVNILILEDDLSASFIAKASQKAGSYDFLSSLDEDIYSAEDGEKIA